MRPLLNMVVSAFSFAILMAGGLRAIGGDSAPRPAQGLLQVRVVSAATGRTVRAATVGVFEADQSAKTDGKGRTKFFCLPLQVAPDAGQYRTGILPPRPYGLFTVIVTARGYQPLVYEMINIYPAAKSGPTFIEARLKPIPTDPRELAAYRERRGKGHVDAIVMGDRQLWLDSVVKYYEAGGGAQGIWTAADLREARETISHFYALLARGEAAQAKSLLHPAMDPAYVDSALKHLAQIEVRKIGEPDPNPDGSAFFPVTLRIKVRPGVHVAWETGISTYFVRLYLVEGRPRIAEITTGP